ncbi:hypothetical protein TraAM80_04908 [Trypanosoma rangeli]|uniref:Uncharacterized protein n=1 Tax=Trypanosoma rangeli TaxID=5698 RepID=A0A422NH31_TRYRA|nr:uncharacterized protein TraAM80_04908 [Trypanosoma rangeli]RNF04783.1 hypothetical protein TraAM80_04908 [Trypanosoma rangeli]|eukprot:RNF04783.1 hypothetical protein TraAM80_04908 [Trypanosoma rangeli]
MSAACVKGRQLVMLIFFLRFQYRVTFIELYIYMFTGKVRAWLGFATHHAFLSLCVALLRECKSRCRALIYAEGALLRNRLASSVFSIVFQGDKLMALIVT